MQRCSQGGIHAVRERSPRLGIDKHVDHVSVRGGTRWFSAIALESDLSPHSSTRARDILKRPPRQTAGLYCRRRRRGFDVLALKEGDSPRDARLAEGGDAQSGDHGRRIRDGRSVCGRRGDDQAERRRRGRRRARDVVDLRGCACGWKSAARCGTALAHSDEASPGKSW